MTKRLGDKQATRLTRIVGEVEGRAFDVDLVALAAITNNVEGINQALVDHPGNFAWWMTLEVLSRSEADRLTETLRLFEAQHIDSLIQTYEAEGKRVPPITRLRHIVTLSEEYRRRAHEAREARRKHRLIQIGRKVVEEKKASIMELSHLLQKEMDARMRPRQTEDARDRMRAAFGSEPHPPRRT